MVESYSALNAYTYSLVHVDALDTKESYSYKGLNVSCLKHWIM